jgi:hypothetical protein
VHIVKLAEYINPKRRTSIMAKRTTTKPAPEPEVEDDDLELDDTEDSEEAEAPKGKGRNRDNEVTFGIPQLVEHLATLGHTVTKRDLRAQIRRMAREDKARVKREIVAGNKSRYDWPNGLEDPEVKRIIKAVSGGEVAVAKKEALDKLKERRATKDADAKPAKSSKGKAKAAPEPEVDDDDEDFEDDED